jgi:hypothetical protein
LAAKKVHFLGHADAARLSSSVPLATLLRAIVDPT